MSPEHKQRVLFATAFLLPIVSLKVTGLLFAGGGPAVASAQPAPQSTDLPPVGAQSPDAVTPEQEAALARLAELAGKPITRSPMFFQPTGTVVTAPRITDGFSIAVSGVMEHGGGGSALIRDRWYRVGDTVAGTPWRIIAIDANDRSVVFENAETGETKTAKVPGARD